MTWQNEVSAVFDRHAIEHNGRRVFPMEAFEQITGVDVSTHPLFFRPELFRGGTDWNTGGRDREGGYFTRSGLHKAIAVVNAIHIWQEKKESHTTAV